MSDELLTRRLLGRARARLFISHAVDESLKRFPMSVLIPFVHHGNMRRFPNYRDHLRAHRLELGSGLGTGYKRIVLLAIHIHGGAISELLSQHLREQPPPVLAFETSAL